MAVLIHLFHAEEGIVPGPRHAHAAHVAFEVACGWTFVWAESEEAWGQIPGSLDDIHAGVFRLQYGGDRRLEGADDWWPASGLLERTDLEWGREVESELLSFAFFMASRMEEQNVSKRSLDGHGRFRGGGSFAAARGWLDRPEVDRRMQKWAKRHKLPLGEARKTFDVLPTFDIDSAFAFRSKGLLRTTGAVMKDWFKGKSARPRLRVALGKAPDPYETYDRIEALHAAFSLRTRYFFLMASRSSHDRGVSWRSKGLRALIQRLSAVADVGIHPGYLAHAKGNRAIAAERERLEQVLGRPLDGHSRQHYLLQRPPQSWRDLVDAGITDDHSMGYADVAGFRAGVSRPFRAFDLERNEQMALWIHPIAVMDATLLRYEKLDPKAAVERVEALAKAVAEVGGGMELVWHNESVSNHGEWAEIGTFSLYTACLSAALKVAKRPSVAD